MSHAPIAVIYMNGVFYPIDAHKRLAAANYGDGEIVTMAPIEERSYASHGHFFALIHQAWVNLPEEYAERFPSEDHLRKWCLIKSGHRDERTTVCASKAEAERLAAFIRPLDDYAIVVPREATVTVWTAKSQSMRAMGKEAFQQSKDDCLRVLSEIIGTDVSTLHPAA